MTVKIINFKVQEVSQMIEDVGFIEAFVRYLLGPPLKFEYHFDVVIKVNEGYITTARKLEPGDVVSLPNKIRLKVWSVDRHGIVKLKTTAWIQQDLRDYHPIEMYLVYPRVHGHMKDKAV